MAIISDVELTAGFQVMIRWFAKASQRYPADENEYYETFFNTLEPNQIFELSDSRFVLSNINEIPGNVEYVIRDICHVQTLIPQFVGVRYFNPDYREVTNLSLAASAGDTTITVTDGSGISVNANIQLGPQQGDVRVVTAISGNVLTLDLALTKNFVLGESVNLANFIMNYPDSTGSNVVARILDNDGNLISDPIEVIQPIFFDTSETVRRYYYTSTLDTPFNGARGSGQTTNQTITIGGEEYEGAWWAFGDVDNTAATEALAIDSQGFEIIPANGTGRVLRDHAFQIELAFAATENDACVNQTTTIILGNHSNFRGIGAQGTTSIRNLDGSIPPAGYYAWESTLPGDAAQRFVKFWDGSAFIDGIVSSGVVDNCPIALTNMVDITTYASESDLACDLGGSSRTVWYQTSSGTAFQPGLVTSIWTNQFGPNSGEPSALGSAFLSYGGVKYIWSGSTLQASVLPCTDQRYCADPSALNTGSGQIADNSLCVYARRICTNEAALNYVAPGNRVPTDIADDGVCVFTQQYTASYSINTNGINGPSAGLRVAQDNASGEAGDPWTIAYLVGLNTGYSWVVQPNNLSATESGTFGNSNVVRSVSLTGEFQRDNNSTPGCNDSGAANYTPGSDGSVACYYGPVSFRSGSSLAAACDNSGEDTSFFFPTNTTRLNTGTQLYSDSNGTRSSAGGWYAKGFNSSRVQNGVVVEGGVTNCPVPQLITNVSIRTGNGQGLDQFGRATFGVNEEFTALWKFNATATADRRIIIGTQGGGGTYEFTTSDTAGRESVTFTRLGTFRLTLTIVSLDRTVLAFAQSDQITITDQLR